MFELLIALAELLGGAYTLLPDGSVMAEDVLGAIASCAEMPASDAELCVTTAIEAF